MSLFTKAHPKKWAPVFGGGCAPGMKAHPKKWAPVFGTGCARPLNIADRAQVRPGEPSPPSRRPLAVSGKKTGGDDELIY